MIEENNDPQLTESLTSLYKFVSRRDIGRSISHLKFLLKFLIECLLGGLVISDEDFKDLIMDCNLTSMVSEHNQILMKMIFEKSILSVLVRHPEVFKAFYLDLYHSFLKNKNNRSSQFNFKIFLRNSLIVSIQDSDRNIEKEFTSLMAENYLKFMNLENSAFIHRQSAFILCKALASCGLNSSKIDVLDQNVQNLIYYNLINEETRSKDCGYLVEIEDFIHKSYLGENIL